MNIPKTHRATELSETKGHGVVVLHDTDPDGYGAAWAISKFLPEATFYPVPHGRPDWSYVKELFPKVVDYSHIIITDLSFDREQHLKLMEYFDTTTVIDHHATAERAIGDLPGVYVDITHSAAWLAWNFFKPTGLTPDLLRYIQDYDIWQHKLPHTHAIASLLQSSMNKPSFGKLDEINDMLRGDNFDMAIELGNAALGYRRSMVALAAENAREVMFEGQSVMCVNVSLPQLISDVGHILDDGRPFSVSWFQLSDGTYKYSLRSRYNEQDQAVDVSLIALKNGGGGHARAAGFISNEKII